MRCKGIGAYKTAWLMCHKIRTALGDVELRQLVGYVEVDETYVGSKPKNKHKGKGGRGDFGGTGGTGKSIEIEAVKRKGNVVARVIDRTDTATLNRFVSENVSTKVSLISTDDHVGYPHLNKKFPHGMVHHNQGEYAHGNIHTQIIEGFWSLVKCGAVGTFDKVSRKYLRLYGNEFEMHLTGRTKRAGRGALAI